MAEHNDLGKLGEQKAADFLEEKGYQIVDRNWHFHHKEVDIIAFDGEVLVFVEVRTRSSSEWLHPRESIFPMKVRYLVLAADAYVRYRKMDNRIRFDIITCLPVNNGKWEIEHIEKAFTAQVE
ncbi:YraN family protein [Geofilum rubicundum]|uniref:UPF0102 protein JCM15548_11996 n=1 Tax=Geofilum rubicundum JCM 15548 TaxID=1236989 RepID=A0A0E9LY16_9BACT|nr:YraN family protein [Geofilum rubicundum]GAO29770.1 UPF0102 protein BT_2236 [Geofilum rubicundum JCM 15548]